ncbi:MAG: cell wall hydrolase [Gammaproteobacteria bacterium]|nr:cell wall hydrolase [Gammaproteobacteria bacterium]
MRTLAFVLMMLGSMQVFAGQVDKEIHCLAKNIYHEARGEPDAGQLAVALVTMNRVYSGKYPNTVCDVVWQAYQFSWTMDEEIYKVVDDEQSWLKAQTLATMVYKKYATLRDDTKGALYYYAPKKVYPHWARFKQVTRTIGSHVFLKERS